MGELDGLRILIAEDDFLISMHMSDILAGRGAHVTVVADLVGLKKTNAEHYDVAIFDSHLRDGAISNEADHLIDAGVRTIYHTGRTDGLREGAVILVKPVEDERLVDAVRPAQTPPPAPEVS